MLLLVLYIVLAIGVSFLCSIMEAVLLSVTPGYMVAMEQRRPKTATRLSRLKDNIDEPLAAILSLNTVAHTGGAAGAGAQAAHVFGDPWIGLFSAALTLAILFLSEIIPKTIGAVYWRQLAPAVSRLLVWLIVPLKPLVWMTGLVSRAISAKHDPVHVSRDEIRALADLGVRKGVLDEGESRVVNALLHSRTLRAADIMTPRTMMFTLPEVETVGAVVAEHQPLGFSRIPIHGDSIDTLRGFVLKDEILERAVAGEMGTRLVDLRRELLLVPPTTRLPHLLDVFLESREHIAAVLDEYGGTAGLVTLEDLLETVLDLEIVDEVDSVEDMRAAARAEWRRRARLLGILNDDEETSGSQG